MKIKFFAVFLCFTLLLMSFSVTSFAAENITEYFDYNGQGISSSIYDILAGIAINAMRQSPDLYRYWFGVRVGEYRYAVVLFPDLDSYELNSSTLFCTVNNGGIYYYNQRLGSFQSGNQTRYQAGVEPFVFFDKLNVQFTRGFAVGNVDASISVHPEYEAVLYYDYIVYILYALCFFLFIFVSFKFLNKRWLLP